MRLRAGVIERMPRKGDQGAGVGQVGVIAAGGSDPRGQGKASDHSEERRTRSHRQQVQAVVS